MPLYESVLILRHDVPAAQVGEIAERYATLVRDHGGTVPKIEQWGLRNLAYRIRKNRKGHYVLLQLDAPANTIAEFERNLRLDEDVLRYLTVSVDEHDAGQSAILRQSEREATPSATMGGTRSGDRYAGGRRDNSFSSSGRPPRFSSATTNATIDSGDAA